MCNRYPRWPICPSLNPKPSSRVAVSALTFLIDVIEDCASGSSRLRAWCKFNIQTASVVLNFEQNFATSSRIMLPKLLLAILVDVIEDCASESSRLRALCKSDIQTASVVLNFEQNFATSSRIVLPNVFSLAILIDVIEDCVSESSRLRAWCKSDIQTASVVFNFDQNFATLSRIVCPKAPDCECGAIPTSKLRASCSVLIEGVPDPHPRNFTPAPRIDKHEQAATCNRQAHCTDKHRQAHTCTHKQIHAHTSTAKQRHAIASIDKHTQAHTSRLMHILAHTHTSRSSAKHLVRSFQGNKLEPRARNPMSGPHGKQVPTTQTTGRAGVSYHTPDQTKPPFEGGLGGSPKP